MVVRTSLSSVCLIYFVIPVMEFDIAHMEVPLSFSMLL